MREYTQAMRGYTYNSIFLSKLQAESRALIASWVLWQFGKLPWRFLSK